MAPQPHTHPSLLHDGGWKPTSTLPRFFCHMVLVNFYQREPFMQELKSGRRQQSFCFWWQLRKLPWQHQQIQRAGGTSRSVGGSADSWCSTGHGGSNHGSRGCRAAVALGNRIFPFEPFVINPPLNLLLKYLQWFMFFEPTAIYEK